MDAPAQSSAASRRERRKAETRARLVASARSLFASRGVDATRINEITEAADVGFGSFYNYFENKDAIVAAVAESSVLELAQTIADATRDLPDAAEVISAAHRAIVARTVIDPELGWLLIRLELSDRFAFDRLAPFALADLQHGIDTARLTVDDPTIALISSGGALLGIVRAVLQGRAGDDPDKAAQLHAANILRMLGVPYDEATEIASRPLPAAFSADRDHG